MRLVIYKIPGRERVLYNLGQLLEKLSKQSQIGILCNKDATKTVDDVLWTFSTNIFLPHDVAVGVSAEDDRQPVLISEKLELLNREVLCLFTNEDLFDVLRNTNKCVLSKVGCIIYMTQEDFDTHKLIDDVSVLGVNDGVDVFEKINKKWHKIDVS